MRGVPRVQRGLPEMTLDELKLRRDGWLYWGRADQPKWPYLRPVFEYLETLPNGNVLTTDGGEGCIEWAVPERMP